jgi:RNA polymerase sigma-70 factor (ECF subfamily)
MERDVHLCPDEGVPIMEMTLADSKSALETAANSHEKEIQELTKVFIRCSPSFYAQALRRLGNPADAEDAVQDAFLSAYTHVNQFRRQSQMSTWLTAIVINSALMKLRRRPRQSHISLDAKDREQEHHAFSDTIRDHQPNPEEICRRWELAQWLAGLSRRLSPALRRTFQMRDVDGLSIRETARRLGVPHGTVKGRVARARAHLKQMVQESLGGERDAI